MWYPELDKKRGAPLADAKQNGWVMAASGAPIIVHVADNGGQLRTKFLWSSVSGCVYNGYWSSNLLQGFKLIGSNVPNGVFFDATRANQAASFYKISVGLEP